MAGTTAILFQTGMPSSNSAELGDLMLRAFIFLVILLIFVLLCGVAWRTIPALRAIARVQEPEKRLAPVRVASPTTQEPEDSAFDPEASPLTFARPVALTEPEEKSVAPLQNKPNPRPLPAEFLHDYEARGEGGAVHNDLEAAIADGRPGTVIRAASDLNGVTSNSPIVIVRREDAV